MCEQLTVRRVNLKKKKGEKGARRHRKFIENLLYHENQFVSIFISCIYTCIIEILIKNNNLWSSKYLTKEHLSVTTVRPVHTRCNLVTEWISD